jgi:hypothetical protein
MTTEDSLRCAEVRMAALARLDGESAELSSAQIDGHIAGCRACQVALAGLTSVHSGLDRMDYERLDVDLWPSLAKQVSASVPQRSRREHRAILGLTAVLVAWRLAQLLLDVPAPVINSVVPLALIVVVLRRLAGDPFALRLSPYEFQEKGAS